MGRSFRVSMAAASLDREHELGPGDTADRRRAVDECEAFLGHAEVHLGHAGLLVAGCARKSCGHYRIAFV